MTVTGDEVRAAKFRVALRGYRPDDVDQALTRAADALDAGLSPATVLIGVSLGKALRGYHTDDVDRLIEALQSS